MEGTQGHLNKVLAWNVKIHVWHGPEGRKTLLS